MAELAKINTWLAPKKADQAQYLRNPDGTFVGFEDTPIFEYHDGFLSVHFQSYNYQETKLTPLQEEAVWYVSFTCMLPGSLVVACSKARDLGGTFLQVP